MSFRALSKTLSIAAVWFLLATAACEPPQPEVGSLPSEDVATIEDMIESYRLAVMARDWDAVADFYTPQGVRNPPNAPEVEAGPEELEAAYGALTAFENPPDEIVGRGDLAYVRGTYSVTARPESTSGPTEDSGVYLAILHRQDDGRWRIAYLIFNSDQPTGGGPEEE